MRIRATRRLQFAAGHRVYGHEGKCRHLHGHNYVVLCEAERDSDTTDDLGRVVDFGVLKDRIGAWIDTEWDHGFLVWQEDHQAQAALEAVPGQKVYLLPQNPTAENLARHLLEVVGPRQLTGTGARLVGVTIWETENCKAEARLPES